MHIEYTFKIYRHLMEIISNMQERSQSIHVKDNTTYLIENDGAI